MPIMIISPVRMLDLAIIRFITYVVGSEISHNDDVLFWVEDDDIPKVEEQYSGYKIIPLAFKDCERNFIVNLMDLENLRENIIASYRDYEDHRLLFLESIYKKLTSSFIAHGKYDLFSYFSLRLNEFSYFLGNFGDMIYDRKDEYEAYYQQFFTKPRVKFAKYFEYFDNYRGLLSLCGFSRDIAGIADNNVIIADFISFLSSGEKELIISEARHKIEDVRMAIDQNSKIFQKIHKDINEIRK